MEKSTSNLFTLVDRRKKMKKRLRCLNRTGARKHKERQTRDRTSFSRTKRIHDGFI